MPPVNRTIRVFISSTFRDMHAERDVLNRVVFPELRKRCQPRGAEFIGVDLRWGVTEDEAQGVGALAVCLDEIERCRPFFVCLLGDRFGWVPPPDEVPAPIFDAARASGAMPPLVAESYQRDDTVEPVVYRLRREAGRRMPTEEADALAQFWETRSLEGAGDSITAREILRGVFDADYPPTHALFYLRTSGVARDPAFPASFAPVFVEPDETRLRKLDALKERIRDARDRVVVRDYDAHYAGVTIDAALLPSDLSPDDRAALDDGVVAPDEWSRVSAHLQQVIEQHGTAALTKTEMDALAERVLDDLWRAIEPELDRPNTLDAHERERAYHDRFVTRHTEFFRGREAERARVVSYVADRKDRELLVVTGEPGSGKSAFMADCVRACRELHPEALVIPHFIGAAPDSASLPATLRSLCETLRREVGLDEGVAEDPDKLRFQLRTFLEQAGARRPVIVFLDALNQLDPSGRSHELDWLPAWAPPGTRIVVSTLAGGCLDQLTRRVPLDHVVTIQALPVDDRRTLIMEFLARRRKTLMPDQLDALLDVEKRPDAGLPLYTLVALEELCLFGDHEALRARIDSLPPTVPELFEQVLARLETDHTHSIVKAVCSWLAVTRSGLLESEALDLLGTVGASPRIRWTRLYRALEPYLKPIEEDPECSGGRLDFFHDQLKSAVYRRYLGMISPDAEGTDRYRESHRQLAGYFRLVAYSEALPTKWLSDRIRSLSELPFHQTRGEMWGELEATLCDLDFIAAKCAAGMTYDLVRNYNVALTALPERREAREKEQERDARVARYAAELVAYARQWSEARDRHVHDPDGVPLPIRGDIPLPDPPAAVPIWTEQDRAADAKRLTVAATQIDRIRAFRQFVCAESHNLVRYARLPGFCVQHAFNFAADGPVSKAATRLIGATCYTATAMLLFQELPNWTSDQVAIRVLKGHSRWAWCLAVTDDGSLFSAGEDGAVRLWDVNTGECVRILDNHSGEVVAISTTPDAACAAAATSDGGIVIWEVAQQRVLCILDDYAMGLAITPDGRRLLAVSGPNLKLWDVQEKTLVWSGVAPEWLETVAVTPDGCTGLTGGRNGCLRTWPLDTGRSATSWMAHRGKVMAVAIGGDGLTAVSAAEDNKLRVWDLETGVMCEEHDGSFRTVAIAASGRVAVSAGRTGIVVRRLGAKDVGLRTIGVATFPWGSSAIAVSPLGLQVVSAAGDPTQHEFSLRVWNTLSEPTPGARSRKEPPVGQVAADSDGTRVVYVQDGRLLLWKPAENAHAVLSVGTAWDTAVVVSPDGRTASSRSVDGVQVWDLDKSERSSEASVGEWDRNRRLAALGIGVQDGDTVSASAVTPDGRYQLVGYRSGAINVWTLPGGILKRHLAGHTRSIKALAIHPDGGVAVSSSGSEVIAWDLSTFTVLAVLPCEDNPARSLTVTRQGIVLGTDNGLRTLWIANLSLATAKN